MASSARSQKQINHLEKKHATLKAQVAELDSKSYLTSGEELQRQALKKKKLHTKDELRRVIRDSEPPPA